MATRQSFIAANLLAGSLAALAAAAPARANSPSPSPAPKETIPPLEFDLAAFDAAAARPASHRHMFATTKVAGGVVLHAVQNTLDAYALLKEPLGAVTTAVVLYHGASITMAFDDAIWKELIVPAIAKAPDDVRTDLADYKTAKANPFLHAAKAADVSVDSLVKGGTQLYVCNNAAVGFARLFAKAANRPERDVYHQLVSGLVPGASLVPAGVWAIGALQERHYTYLQATL